MTEHRFSIWQVLGILAIILALCAGALGGGLLVGYRWGRASGLAEARAQAATAPQVFSLPHDFGQGGLPDMPGLPLERGRQIQGAYLGVRYEMVTPELARAESLPVEMGALIRAVVAGSPAEAAGLKAGDIVTAVDEVSVDANHPLATLIGPHQPGDQVNLTLRRGNETREIPVTLGGQPAGGSGD